MIEAKALVNIQQKVYTSLSQRQRRASWNRNIHGTIYMGVARILGRGVPLPKLLTG